MTAQTDNKQVGDISASKRTPYEQMEFQRTHSWLYTTLSQQVNFDGSLLTFQEVTKNIQKQLDRLEELHDSHLYWWTVAPYDQQQMYFFLLKELDKVREGFVTNYKRMLERCEKLTDDDSATPDGGVEEVQKDE